jgi:hypothetical protein
VNVPPKEGSREKSWEMDRLVKMPRMTFFEAGGAEPFPCRMESQNCATMG